MNQNIQFFDFFKKVLKLRQFIKKINPDIIQSWMYHSNFISLFISKKCHQSIFWNIRHSELNSNISKKRTVLLSILCGLFSRVVPKKIVYCSDRSINFHQKYHYYLKNKTILIDNGYNDKKYFPSTSQRLKFRSENKINKSDIIIGYAGRYAKQKNIPSLLIAFSKIVKNKKNVYLYMAGKEISNDNKRLAKLISNLKIENRVVLLNQQENLSKFYNGIDLLVLVSHSESFSNVLAESMLCSTPVLSNDSGCSKKIVGKNGFIINKNNHQSVFNGLTKILNLIKSNKKEWRLIKRNSRFQIQKNFSEEKMANSYLKTWLL